MKTCDNQIVKIVSDQIINTLNINLELRKLTCKICFCILINPKKCYNKKCGQLCCENCIESAMSKNKICPFCKNKSSFCEYKKLLEDDIINEVLKNLSIICNHIDCKNELFTKDLYIEHIKKYGSELSYCSNIKHIQNNNNDYIENSWKKLKQCSTCKKVFCKKCEDLLIIPDWREYNISCLQCLQSLTFDFLQNKNDCLKCENCGLSITKLTNPFYLDKCVICGELFCSNCVRLCCTCKGIVCMKDLVFCSECKLTHYNSYQCLQCYNKYKNSSYKLFKECDKCNNKYCLNCLNCCNTCNKFICLSCNRDGNFLGHKCPSCEETACENHLYKCDICFPDNNINDINSNSSYISNNYDNSSKKVCIKNCKNQCEICKQISTPLCDQNKHPIISNATNCCEHQICTNCISKCSICFEDICQKCSTIYHNSVNCKICKMIICFSCASYCPSCLQACCRYHRCLACREESMECLNCLNSKYKIKCLCCGEKLNCCEKCLYLVFCSNRCFLHYKSNMIKLDNKKNKVNDDEEDKDDKSNKNNDNDDKNNDENNFHLCNMFYCKECQEKIRASLMENLNFKKRKRNRLTEDDFFDNDKVVTTCEESCACIIF